MKKVLAKTFSEKVLDIVAKIPKGNVMTYGEVAGVAGTVGAGRAVGNIISKNKNKNIQI